MKRQLFSLLNILLFTLCFTLANQLTFIFFEKHTKTSALMVGMLVMYEIGSI